MSESFFVVFISYFVIGGFIFMLASIDKDLTKISYCDRCITYIFWPITIIAIIFAAVFNLVKAEDKNDK